MYGLHEKYIASMRLQATLFVVVAVLGEAFSGKLLLILLDGFRWDYFDQGLNLPAFTEIFRRGVRAQQLVPAYPPVSYPNHYTLLTGLYVESHGFVGNEMYDVTTGKTYSPWFDNLTAADRSFMYDDSEPLWISAVKQNKRVYMFHWVGCEVTIQGRQPTYCRRHTDVPSIDDFRRDLDDSVDLFLNSSADLAVVYHEKVDDDGHRYGPMTSKVNSAIQEVDEELGRMLKKLASPDLGDTVDVMIFSDHGMTTISPSQVVNVSSVLPTSSVDVILNGYGSHVYIWPKPGRLQEVYNALKDYSPYYTAYLKEDIPARWHFQHHRRVPPILLAAKMPWYIDTPNFGYYAYDTGPMLGEHGFDPAEADMSGIFTAFGPSFVPGMTSEKLPNVDLYQIMCNILNIKPRSHNGTWSRVSHMIKDVSGSRPLQSALTVVVFCIILAFLNTWCLPNQ
ncbi:glycerophosphocholine cholinephosphodiesterase ENPP6-like [Haliotis cracherodii]|uniref:glycerophosphocholine cholinephosphodiesterase ENPP6-like n=1 Tax=Haliotis cracherodii TaxID=6455 RepID=UPI0039EBC970